ncbi:MAG: hypothetical protein ACJ70R_08120 [Nitrososphaera sp.]
MLWNENKTHGNKKEKILIPNIISSSINIGSDNNNSIIVITSNTTTPAAATPTTNNTTTTSLPSEIELSSQPVYQEQEKLESQIPINQTHLQVIVSGNRMLTLPNGTETLRTTSTKTGIVSMVKGAFTGKEILTTEDGSESATATVYQLVRFNLENGVGRAYIHTDSTGRLAPLEGMILIGIDELYPDGSGMLTLWEWLSGIPLPSTTTTTTEEPPLINTTTTNATADINATAATEEEGE